MTLGTNGCARADSWLAGDTFAAFIIQRVSEVGGVGGFGGAGGGGTGHQYRLLPTELDLIGPHNTSKGRFRGLSQAYFSFDPPTHSKYILATQADFSSFISQQPRLCVCDAYPLGDDIAAATPRNYSPVWQLRYRSGEEGSGRCEAFSCLKTSPQIKRNSVCKSRGFTDVELASAVIRGLSFISPRLDAWRQRI
jgi:hypothetical protein